MYPIKTAFSVSALVFSLLSWLTLYFLLRFTGYCNCLEGSGVYRWELRWELSVSSGADTVDSRASFCPSPVAQCWFQAEVMAQRLPVILVPGFFGDWLAPSLMSSWLMFSPLLCRSMQEAVDSGLVHMLNSNRLGQEAILPICYK